MGNKLYNLKSIWEDPFNANRSKIETRMLKTWNKDWATKNEIMDYLRNLKERDFTNAGSASFDDLNITEKEARTGMASFFNVVLPSAKSISGGSQGSGKQIVYFKTR
ncbi:MAG: hypothetical protein ACTSXQ_03000 [Alphaproteobacteria bacterium]